MIARISWPQSALNFFLNRIVECLTGINKLWNFAYCWLYCLKKIRQFNRKLTSKYKPHCCTVHFVESLQLLTNNCAYINSTLFLSVFMCNWRKFNSFVNNWSNIKIFYWNKKRTMDRKEELIRRDRRKPKKSKKDIRKKSNLTKTS